MGSAAALFRFARSRLRAIKVSADSEFGLRRFKAHDSFHVIKLVSEWRKVFHHERGVFSFVREVHAMYLEVEFGSRTFKNRTHAFQARILKTFGGLSSQNAVPGGSVLRHNKVERVDIHGKLDVISPALEVLGDPRVERSGPRRTLVHDKICARTIRSDRDSMYVYKVVHPVDPDVFPENQLD
jgi:hypothetical protein